MIGNDIISLTEARLTKAASRPRYIQKVLAHSERIEVLQSVDPELYLWIFWALKESAYKLDFKTKQSPYFAPKKIICSGIRKAQTIDSKFLNEENNQFYHANVKTPLFDYSGLVKVSENFIHAICYTKSDSLVDLNFSEIKLSDKTPKVQSNEVRQFLIEKLQIKQEIPSDKISICSPKAYPKVMLNNCALNFDVSMSHHIHWGGVAYVQKSIQGS